MYRKSIFLIFICVTSILPQDIKISKSDSKPVIDGIISPGEYGADFVNFKLIQLEPFKGEESTEKTDAYISQDDKNLYFGFMCFDSSPEKLAASIQSRDKLSSDDDAIFIVLDTYNDKRSGFGFAVNPINTQADFRIRDDGRSLDYKWDAEWFSEAKIDSNGWTVEFAIPFESLSYNSKSTEWGLSVRRIIKKNTEISYWPGGTAYDYQISKGGIISGLVLPEVYSPLSITPYTTFRFENSRETNNENKYFGDIGADAVVRITSGLIGNITVNPDFATVEADEERVNLSRYELRYPEKRLFFMEGNELYSTRIKTFYSRRIGDIIAGAKVSGKIGGYTVSLISAKTNDRPEIDQPSTFYSAFRIKKDILKSSSVGFTFADKSRQNSFARSFSLDYVLNLADTWKLTGQLVGSAPGDITENLGWFVKFANESNIHHFHLRYTDLGTNFRENVNQTGFVVDDDRREIDSDLEYKWWFKNSYFKYIEAESRNNIFWSHNGTLRSYSFSQGVLFYLENKFSFEFGNRNRFRLFEKKFHFNSYSAEFGYNKEEWASAEFSYEWGKNFDSNFNSLQFQVRINPINSMALEYSIENYKFTPDYEFENTTINMLSVNYNFTPDLWLKLFAQNNSSIDKIYLYGLFGWRFFPPFSAVYLIYTFEELQNEDFIGKENNRILYLKFSYQIDF